jgi:TM2 domain-containing membrane protein YozV
MKYYILIGNKTAGPHSLEEVKALYQSHMIDDTNLYATTESQDWMPISMLIPLFSIPSLPSIPSNNQPSIVINNSNSNVGYIPPNPCEKSYSISNLVKSRIAYQIFAFFLGFLGFHNFYAGYNGKGFAQLFLTILTCGYGAIISWIWAIIEIFTVSTDSNGIPME